MHAHINLALNQVRATAAAVVQALLEGPPQRAFLAIAEVQAKARHVVRCASL